MKFGLFVLVALAVGVVGAHFLLEDTGYVLIDIRGKAVEMSVPFLVFSLVAIYALIRLLVHLWRLPRKLGRAYAAGSGRRATRLASRGLIDIAEGNPAKGERLLTRGARRHELPLANYLEAARAAHAQGATDRRDTWLKMAREQQPEANAAVLLTQAELQLADGQLDDAEATLREVPADGPHRKRLLALTADIQRQRENWDALASLLPALIKNHALAPEALDALQCDTARARLADAAGTGDVAALDAVWNALSKGLRARPDMFADYARALARCGDHDALEKLLRRRLKAAWDDELVTLYGELETSRPAGHLSHAEAWLTRRGEDPVLLLTTARLCMQNQLWGKARSYLETSLALRPDAAAYRVYAQLLDKMGEGDAATEAYRLGLETAMGGARRPALTAPPASESGSA
jgi:HemY protein